MAEPDPFAYYRQLLAKVDTHAARVSSDHGDAMHCQRGCTACCRQDLGVARVEADHIRDWVARRDAALPPSHDSPGIADQHNLFASLSGSQPCAFLGAGGACLIYEVRPVICRSHGLPIAVGNDRDCCPLNFGDESEPLSSLPDDAALDLERLNTMLAAIDHAYARQLETQPDRVRLSELRRELDEA